MSVRMELSRIFIRELTDVQIIELTEAGGERNFPIVIGLPEAAAIERRLKGTEVARPQTHDLLASVIRHLGGKLLRIDIHDLSAGTFYANIVIERDGEEIAVDSRPSDAIALGIAEKVPIFVAESVLEQAAVADAAGAAGESIVDFDDTDDDDE
ncbi:MAG: bifunctional nuclease family protein [Phycisphaerales bacterium]